jgi:beta-lactamase regulating signal transducer with metallopeptidase domain
MNDFGIALIWLAMQVTAMTVAGLALTILTGRGTPGAGASVARTALAATIVLGLLARCPLPSWWSWEGLAALPIAASPAEPPPDSEGEASAVQLDQSSRSSSGSGVQVSRLLSALRGLRLGSTADGEHSWFWRWQIVVTFLAGMASALGVLRLLLGLWAIRHGWYRSQPVNHPEMLSLIDELRESLGVKRPVTVRESADLTTAATVGWRKPVLLLPADWLGWTAEQRRVVVAHELAHIARGDFAAWLLAQLSVALYFWHPLVRVLAGRLRLHQELAADDAAAPLAGGRPAYLRALAELALRADGLAHGWPAPAFLSGRNTLLRRIEMLRVMEDGVKRPAFRIGRRLTMALVLVLALTASALRGPVRQTWAAAADSAEKPAPVAPFDLSLLSPVNPEADGVFGIRLAVLVNRPGTERWRQQANAAIDLVIGKLDPDGASIHVEDVEQVMGRLFFKGENKAGKRALMMSLNVLKTTKDVDWAKLGKQCGLKMKPHHYRGETYVSVTMPEALIAITGTNGETYLWTPDARTLVLDSKKGIKALIEAKAGKTKPALPPFAEGWDMVSRGFFAAAIDNRGRRLFERTVTKAELKHALSDPKKAEYHLTRFYQKVSTMVVGFAGRDDFHFDLRASADTPAEGARLTKDCEGALAAAKIVLADAPEHTDKADLDFLRNALDRAVIHREGEVVTIHTDVPAGFDRLLSHGLKEMSREKK